MGVVLAGLCSSRRANPRASLFCAGQRGKERLLKGFAPQAVEEVLGKDVLLRLSQHNVVPFVRPLLTPPEYRH